MRAGTPLLLAALVAGCSSAGGHDRSVLMSGIRPGMSGKVHRIGPKRALAGAESARSFWHHDLTKEARLAPGRRFASPPRTVLLGRLQREASEHGFEIVSVKMLHPLQLAPEVVVRSTHYVALSRAMGQILRAVDPNGRDRWDYEGFYFEARDEYNVPFFAAYNVIRGQIMGGQWARSEALYPFPHG